MTAKTRPYCCCLQLPKLEAGLHCMSRNAMPGGECSDHLANYNCAAKLEGLQKDGQKTKKVSDDDGK